MGEGNPARAIYYALNDNLSYVYQLKRSIESVRCFNREIAIYVAFWGPLEAELRDWLDRFDVRILHHESERGPRSANFLKWLALEHRFEEDEIAYMDTDTVVHSDISELFDAAGPQDLHARIEASCHREPYPILFGLSVTTVSQIYHDLFDRVRQRLNAADMPVFNTGVMIFKNGFHRVMATRFGEFERIDSLFLRKRIPYPCSNAHIIGEIISTLVLGRLDGVTWSTIEPDASPYYAEIRCGDTTGPPLVTHFWSYNYPAYILETYGPEEYAKYVRLVPARKPWRVRLLQLWIRVGTSIFRPPGFVMRAWLAIPSPRL